MHFRYDSEKNAEKISANQNVTKGEVVFNAQGQMALRQIISIFDGEFENVSTMSEGLYVVCVVYDGKIVYA